jgi:hypothetical protein
MGAGQQPQPNAQRAVVVGAGDGLAVSAGSGRQGGLLKA